MASHRLGATSSHAPFRLDLQELHWREKPVARATPATRVATSSVVSGTQEEGPSRTARGRTGFAFIIGGQASSCT